jgi:Tfp pilus assembly pilus retraction ATPase PilT
MHTRTYTALTNSGVFILMREDLGVILGVDPIITSKIDNMRSHINLNSTTQVQIINTTAMHPSNKMGMGKLHQQIVASEPEPILLHTTGSAPVENGEVAWSYQKPGVKRFITSQIFIAQRAGNILAAVNNALLALCNISISAKIANGVNSIFLISLVRLLIPDTYNNISNQKNMEAAV